uniref:F5/8 type C domain-containing protein n=1 Tax=Branchiostoma floridae TaxID=7739 RepID=C3YIQ5_BRAFL|eukprot:XP_002603768.1 hypothetical protein BRAFLDRAFT_86596 [Branchiostoma floridae]
MQLVKYEGAKKARSLGDPKLFQPYFICLEEDNEKMQTYIKYGIGSDTSEKGLVYMVYIDKSPPLGIRFYSFGTGENDLEIMDARVIEGGATGEMECSGGTVLEDGICVEDCHPECNGCIPRSPGSKLDTECRSCKHFSIPKGGGLIQCVAECPPDTIAAADGVTCICKDFVVVKDDGSNQCVSACPADKKVASDGKTCGSKWRDDSRCGPSFPAKGANPGQCDPGGPNPCCSSQGYCGSTEAHCTCEGCEDYRYQWLARDSSWVVDSSGTPWVSNGVTHDAAKALDGVAGTYWNPVGTDRHSARHIVLDLKEPHTLTRIALNNFGNTVHDIKAFKLQKSTLWSPFHWEDVVSVTDVKVGTDRRQEFGGFRATARYWRLLITRTSEGWQPRLRELNLYGISSSLNPSPAKWRDDFRCGPSIPTEGGNPAQCNPKGPTPCCSNGGWCGSTEAHCTCDGCKDYRYEWLARDSSWVVDSSGTPWVSNGVTHDAAKALDGVAGTYWNPVGTVRHSVRHIVLDLKEPHTLSRIALNNYGNTLHDIKAFKLQKSTLWSPFHWEDVVSVTDVKVGTDRRQEFGGFRATARYWRLLITRTSEGWQPRLRELNLYGISSPWNPSPAKWRDDFRCGPSIPTEGGNPAQCNPKGPTPCCSNGGWCGSTEAHCTCDGCKDYRYEWLARDSSWVVDSSGTPWVINGVTHDAAKALDGVAGTYWNPVGTDRHSARHIVLDLKEPHTLTRIALNNYGNTVHDIKAFKLQKSTLWSPFHWEDVVSVTDVEVGTDRRQEFGGFRATARYWRLLITETSEGFQPRLRELNLLGVLSPRNPSPVTEDALLGARVDINYVNKVPWTDKGKKRADLSGEMTIVVDQATQQKEATPPSVTREDLIAVVPMAGGVGALRLTAPVMAV